MQDWSDRIFQQYTARLVALARSRMQGSLQSRFDPEDVVMSAWRSFFCGGLGKELPGDEAESLWPLLATLTLRKLSKNRRMHRAAKRAVQETVELSELQTCAAIAGEDPSAEDVLIADEIKQLLLSVFNPRDQHIIKMSIEGYLQNDIAMQLDISDRTVRRVVQAARAQLESVAEFRVELIPVQNQESSLNVHTFGLSRNQLQPKSVQSGRSGIVPSLQQISYADVLLKRLVGTGSFGKVYEAIWRPNENRVAIKFLRKGFWKHESARQQFLQEVDLVARVSHANVIKYYGWGQSPHGGPYITMEYINGTTLCQRISSYRTLNEKLDVLRAIASALAAVHSNRIVHGDLSPVNILVDKNGRVVLTDFGFAHSLAMRDARSTIGGTLGFAAPEQLNVAFGEPNTASDIYAWGAIAWYLLVGSPLSESNDPFKMVFDTLSARPHELAALSELHIPRALTKCIAACLEKDGQLRPTSAEVISVLSNLVDL